MVYDIYGKYKAQEWEILEVGIETERDVQYLLKEYKMAFGVGWQFKVKKVRSSNANNN